MPFIDAKVNVKVSENQEKELKERLGKAIEIIPGKSESWLMVGIQDEYKLYFKGENTSGIAYIEVKIMGSENKAAFNELTAAISDIFNQILGIAQDKIYIKYEAVTNWGWNGSNF